MKIELVGDWKDAWKWLSVQAGMVMAIVSAAYASLPQLQSLMAPTTYATIMAVLGAAIPVLRVISQQGTPGEEPTSKS